jgi:AcrR family transcriptional regulator
VIPTGKDGCENVAVGEVVASERPRPGGRAARVVAAVHAATFELLEEVGYELLQLPQVAERADVNRTTVYRRWPTKAVLVADLLASLMQVNVPTPDTGTLQGDLEQLLTQVAAVLTSRSVRAVLRASMTVADDSPDVQRAQAAFWDERFARSGALIERAVARAELPAGTDPRTVLETAASPIYLRSLFTSETITPEYINQVAYRTTRAFGDQKLQH